MTRLLQPFAGRIIFAVLTGMAAFLFVTTAVALPAADSSVRGTLTAISRQMASEGNARFMLVEALSDSLLRDGQAYELTYMRGKMSVDGGPEELTTIVRINGTRVPEPLHTKYVRLIHAFTATDSAAHPAGLSLYTLKGDHIRLSEVLDPTSALRRKDPPQRMAQVAAVTPVAAAPAAPDLTGTILKEMAQDRLIDTNREVYILYDPKGVSVNGRALKTDMNRKYQQRFQELYGFRAGKTGSVEIRRTPDAVYQDNR